MKLWKKKLTVTSSEDLRLQKKQVLHFNLECRGASY